MATDQELEDWIIRSFEEAAALEERKLDLAASEAEADRRLRENALTQSSKQFSQSLAWDKEKFAQELELRREQLDQGWEQLAIDRGRAYADAWYKEQLVDIAWAGHALDSARLGLDYLKTVSELASRPENYFALADFAAGAQQRQDVPLFVQDLINQTTGPAFQQAGAQPAVRSMQDAAAQAYGTLGWQPGAVPPSAGAPVPGGAPLPTQVMLNPSDEPLGDAFGEGGLPTGAFVPRSAGGYPQGDGRGIIAPPWEDSGVQQTGRAWSPGRSGFVNPVPASAGGGAAQPGPVGPTAGAQAAGAEQVAGIVDAIPPSATAGWDPQDVAALNAIAQVYRQGAHNLAPGALESMKGDDRQLLLAGIARLGGSPKRFLEEYWSSRPAQGSPTQA